MSDLTDQTTGESHHRRLTNRLQTLIILPISIVAYALLVIITKVVLHATGILMVILTRIPWLFRMTIIHRTVRIFSIRSNLEASYLERHINDKFELDSLSLPFTLVQELTILTICLAYPFTFRSYVRGIVDLLVDIIKRETEEMAKRAWPEWSDLVSLWKCIAQPLAYRAGRDLRVEVTQSESNQDDDVTRSRVTDQRNGPVLVQTMRRAYELHSAACKLMCGLAMVIDSVPLSLLLLAIYHVHRLAMKCDWYLVGLPLGFIRGEHDLRGRCYTGGESEPGRSNQVQSVVIEMHTDGEESETEAIVSPDQSGRAETGQDIQTRIRPESILDQIGGSDLSRSPV